MITDVSLKKKRTVETNEVTFNRNMYKVVFIFKNSSFSSVGLIEIYLETF